MSEVQTAQAAVTPDSALENRSAGSDPASDQTQVQQAAVQTTEAATTQQQEPTQQQQASQTTVSGSEPDEATTKLQKELQNVRRRAQDAERRAERLEREAEARNTSTTPPTTLSGNQQSTQSPIQAPVVSGDKSPDISDFSDINDFVAAKVEWQLKQSEVKKSQELEQKSQKDHQDEVNRSYNRKVSKVLDKLPDFNDVMQNAEIALPIPVLEAIKESDMGPEIAYHLATNVDEADRLGKLSPLAAVREIGKIEAKLSAPLSQPKTKQVTQAPEPIKPTPSQASSTKKTLDEMSTDEFMAARNAELAKRRQQRGNPNW